MNMKDVQEFSSVLANLGVFGAFVVAAWGLRKPHTRQRIGAALKRLSTPVPARYQGDAFDRAEPNDTRTKE